MQQLTLQLAPPPEPRFETYFPARNEAALGVLRTAAAGTERFVYLWGPRGSGKTHLLHAFAAACSPAARYAAPGQGLDGAGPDAVVACDDVQKLDLVGQLALFDLYNRLRTGGGSLLCAGDRPPAELPLREDLRTRMGACVVLRVEPLNDEEKRAALAWHAGSLGITLEDEWLDYLFARAGRDMGTQMAVINTLDRLSLERKRPVSLPLLREVIQLVEQEGRT